MQNPRISRSGVFDAENMGDLTGKAAWICQSVLLFIIFKKKVAAFYEKSLEKVDGSYENSLEKVCTFMYVRDDGKARRKEPC